MNHNAVVWFTYDIYEWSTYCPLAARNNDWYYIL